MRQLLRSTLIAVGVLGLARVASAAPSVTFDFQDGTDQGWGGAFGTDSDTNFQIVTNSVASGGNGTNYIRVPRTGFQDGAYDANGPTFLAAMQAAAAAPATYVVSYDWYIDTSLYAANPGTFLQIGTFINTASGWYSQDFGTPNEISLSGTQLASGQVFSGHVAVPLTIYPADATHGGDLTTQAAQTFFRLGVIENGNGTLSVDFDNVSVAPVPEPTTIALLGLAVPALALRRRRLA